MTTADQWFVIFLAFVSFVSGYGIGKINGYKEIMKTLMNIIDGLSDKKDKK
jgi:hypothetical protein